LLGGGPQGPPNFTAGKHPAKKDAVLDRGRFTAEAGIEASLEKEEVLWESKLQ
jgi:hypothetical protein